MNKFVFRDNEIRSVGFFGLGKSNAGVMNYLAAHYPHLTFTLRQDKPIFAGGAHLSRDFSRIYIGKNALRILLQKSKKKLIKGEIMRNIVEFV